MPEISTAKRPRLEGDHAEREPENRAEVADARDIREWLTSIGSLQEISVAVHRISPRTWKGISIEGLLDRFNEFIDDDFIRDRYGGGTYKLVVNRRDDKNRMVYAASRQIKIGGVPPKLADDFVGEPLAATAGDITGSAVNNAMSFMAEQARNARQEAREAAKHAPTPAIDPAIAQMFTSQLESQKEANLELQRANAQKEQRILELLTRRPDGDGFQEKILSKMLDGESSRIESLRVQHESELRTMRETARQDVERERERHRDEIRSLEKRHDREIQTIQDASRTTGDAHKIANETRIDGLKAETARLERELATMRTELGELRARKDKTLPEQAKELVSLSETFKGLGIGGKDDDDEEDDSKKPFLERMFGRVMDHPEAIGQLIGGVRQNIPTPPPQAAPMPQPQMKRKKRKPGVMQEALVGGPTPAGVLAPGDPAPIVGQPSRRVKVPKLDPVLVAQAVVFIESAVKNNTDPVTFAGSARSMIPGDILVFIERVGVDAFLSSLELTNDSPLRTQRGRNFVRAVAKVLLEGAPEAQVVSPAPVEPPAEDDDEAGDEDDAEPGEEDDAEET